MVNAEEVEISKLEINLYYFCNYCFVYQELARNTDIKILSKQEAPLREGGKEAMSNMWQMWTYIV